jgi:hypothetical protein
MEFHTDDFPGGYHVTGVLYNSTTRFKRTFSAGPSGARFALGINLWRGSVWGVYADGTRQRLKSVYN